jgi:hypothetical protein
MIAVNISKRQSIVNCLSCTNKWQSQHQKTAYKKRPHHLYKYDMRLAIVFMQQFLKLTMNFGVACDSMSDAPRCRGSGPQEPIFKTHPPKCFMKPGFRFVGTGTEAQE